ncbi:MAG: 16S rRNA (guanine(966)-N(2))-methyltransferase RsmD [Erysipelotrichaceae bacterium]|nr:16S rRNA (guanine(966)-N(2))-methyltransferase RsmD [Erysipelotrichaceae bacterium]
MRITAGYLRNRQIRTLSGDNTRPTTEKVREAVFSHLGTYFDGGLFLDLFAGSGAMALEAISRGMDRAVLVDNSAQAIAVINANVRDLDLASETEILKCSYKTALARFGAEGRSFDYIFIDPPYRFQLGSELLEEIRDRQLLKPEGTIIVETRKEEEIREPEGLRISKSAVYGISRITYVKRS